MTGGNPDTHVSPHQDLLKDEIEFEDPLIPLAQADELAVDILAEDHPKSDCYIDDIFTAFLETDVKRGSRICPIYSTLAGSPTIA
jgi:hypothetical protein